MNDTCQIPGTTVPGDCMNYRCKISNDKSRMQLKPLGKISCLMENGTCLDKGDTITDEVSCLKKECKLYKYSNNTVATGIIERFYGCPYEERCEDIGTIKQDTQSCTTKKCRMFNNGLFMNWKIIDQGCSVGDGCRNHAERWNEDTESMCVVKSCNVKAEGKNGYTWNTDIISHGCRSFNGTCYYNGDTWMDDGCFTKNCTVSETEDGGSSMKTDIVGGICKAVDGSCVEYGKEFLAQEGGPPCVCVEATSTDGYSIGQTSCPVPAL
ncbi:hypothetical protein KP79_PYT13650 [Mizuhopecten yessoensis]|uniref:Uncharacterized protein n=1 Tax=Mizuhopecten yessoensis TaxID=6573 RepID=A0A210QXR3_MIZYE|nr:hypothetical protein KP79_PYT13650 [Mizuhopecten yessoensis]